MCSFAPSLLLLLLGAAVCGVAGVDSGCSREWLVGDTITDPITGTSVVVEKDVSPNIKVRTSFLSHSQTVDKVRRGEAARARLVAACFFSSSLLWDTAAACTAVAPRAQFLLHTTEGGASNLMGR